MIYPENIPQNSNESVVTSDGKYDFNNLSKHEVEVIREVLNIVDGKKYPKKLKGLGLANEAFGITYKPRYILHEVIIQKYETSNNPYDLLAVAEAYKSKGAYGRKKAIEFYELYINSVSEEQKKVAAEYYFGAQEPYFSYHLSELYESDNRLEEALFYAKQAFNMRVKGAPGYPLRIGTVLLKINPSDCVEFYLELFNTTEYKLPQFQKEYKRALDRMASGYKYRPRPRAISEDVISMEEDVKQAASQFVGLKSPLSMLSSLFGR